MVVDKIRRLGGGSLDGLKVAVWGLTFKARTDDLRESPSLAVIHRLVERGVRVVGFDPTVARDLGIKGLETVTDPYAACEKADVLAVLTEWDEFRWLDFDKVKEVMATPAVVDARNLLDPAPLKRRGFTYEGIGRT
jgi:UDPglucose 6-dehydrogenase